VSFSKPFRKPLNAVFFVKRGNPAGFDATNIAGNKIGFLDGHASNIFCVRRAGITGVDQISEIVHYTTREEVVAGVNDGEVDAVFANDQIFNLQTDLDVASATLISTCMQDGAGMMVRKDSHLPDWWNSAFDALKETSQYRDICSEILERHDQSDHEVECVD
jgi:ABC-type amino acid transport substrate-binding protein